jgi:hypothetical protein
VWIFTDFGFFSVVAHRDEPDRLLVRARVRSDLEALTQAIRGRGKSRIYSTPDHDYPFRCIVKREAFGRALSELAERIQYDNFKNSVAATQGSERAHVYLGIWDHLRRWLQRPAPEPFRKASVGYED